ncbi:MAG: TPM domain-containing protein [Firmicutes bacterium]|nr:TPM domain-containing protein [Bacillota bacterium]
MKKRLTITVLVLLSLCLSGTVMAAFPKAVGYINDFANVIDNKSKAELQLLTDALRDEQGVELVVLTMSSVQPYTAREYRTLLFEEWGIGGPEDSGLLILLVMDTREIEVEVGYGLEGILPDGKVGAILDQFAVPYFRQDKYGAGLVETTKAFRAELLGESFLLPSKSSSADWFKTFIIFLAIAIFVSKQSRRTPPGGPSGRSGTGRRTIYVSPRVGGGRGGFGGGSSGGGFGGFGGGRSGGGGAGRKF